MAEVKKRVRRLMKDRPKDDPTPMTRKEAVQLGLLRYMPIDKKCKQGHTTWFRTNNSQCIECLNAKAQVIKEADVKQGYDIDRELIAKWDRITLARLGVGNMYAKMVAELEKDCPILYSAVHNGKVMGPFKNLKQAKEAVRFMIRKDK